MSFYKSILGAGLTLMLAQTAYAHEYKIGPLTIDHPHSFATPPSAKSGAGYMTITNTGDMADRLMGVTASFAKTMIHKSEMKDGVMKMRHQMGGVLLEPDETVTFEPGGYHVMFMELEAPFKDGEENSATLIFKNAGEIDVNFSVEVRNKKTDGHSGHSTN